MTQQQILEADAATLNIEAHRLMGTTIERCEEPGKNPYWKATTLTGLEWSSYYWDYTTPTMELLGLLQVELFTESWEAAEKLFNHSLWPKDLYFRSERCGNVKIFVVFGYMSNSIAYSKIIESTLPLAITRAFVMANNPDPTRS